MNKLGPDFFLREDVVQIARELLGKRLFTRVNNELTSGFIVETEAYGGPLDRASHAWNGRRTERTKTMYLPGGHAYVYLCYGMYELFNVVTGPADQAFAVLIRALEPETGIEIMLRRRVGKNPGPSLGNGPGVLARSLGISREHNAISLLGETIWLEHGQNIAEDQILASARVGIGFAGEAAHFPWRFRVKDHPYASPAK